MKEYIDFKIEVLKDFLFLSEYDEREQTVRDILAQCKSRTEIDNSLYNIMRFNESVDEFIERRM
jgi:hypothetical protein